MNDWKTIKKEEYANGGIAIIETEDDFRRTDTARIDGVLVILCMEGTLTININGNVHVAHRNDFVICLPETVLSNATAGDGFKFRCLFMSMDYAMKMLPLSVKGWSMRMFFEKAPIQTFTETETAMFNQYFDLLKQKFADTENTYRDKVIDALVLAMVYDFRDVFDKYMQTKPRSLSSAENIFEEFLMLMSTTYPKPRNVAWYADKLNITPKYLSVVCRKTYGLTASKLIDNYVVRDIATLLKGTRKSMKEIAAELDFPNTSFFGRYVKKNLGCTPVEYRRREMK